MALVTGFERLPTHRSKVHPTETECGYAIFKADGRQLLQIESGGSSERMHKGKVSQTYQFDLESARELMRIIRQAFPELS